MVDQYNIMILGSGGREHALAWKISQSTQCGHLYVAPGNAGTSDVAVNLDLDISDFGKIRESIDRCQIEYLIVGPEAPLVAGIYDYFLDHPVKVIGPSKAASVLEGSKAFANAFMEQYNIPTASSKNFTIDNIQEAYDYIDQQKSKIVLKADGLAAGKGVLIIDDKAEAKVEIKKMLDGKFGDASATVVIEEFLDGLEFSVFVATDGKAYTLLPIAKDYKRIGEGDTGLNTGGMGAISPVPFVDDAMIEKVVTRIIEPTIEGLKNRQLDYKGFVFIGLINVGGEPYVIEYNCRLGDPETEVILPRIESDLMDIIIAVHNGTLSETNIVTNPNTAATIMLVSGGYPEAYEKGKEIIIDQSETDSILFHAGTIKKEYSTLTNGGRVIAVTSIRDNHTEAVQASVAAIENIHFEDMRYRKDIGFDL